MHRMRSKDVKSAKQLAKLRNRERHMLRLKEKYGGIDWNKPSKIIAAETGFAYSKVIYLRGVMAPETLHLTARAPGGGAKPRYDWPSVDWTQFDTLIAKRLGCSRERVRQQRVRLAKDVEHADGYGRVIIPKGFNFKRHTDIIAKELGCCTGSVCRFRRMYAPETIGKFRNVTKYNWAAVDWRKCSGDIAAQLGIPCQMVSNYRYRRGKPAAETDGRRRAAERTRAKRKSGPRRRGKGQVKHAHGGVSKVVGQSGAR